MGLIAGLVKEAIGVFGKFVPDKTQREQLAAQLSLAFMSVVESMSTANQYDTKFSATLKGSARWIIALMFTCFYIYARVSDNVELTPLDSKLMLGLWGFLFLSRTIEKLKGRDK